MFTTLLKRIKRRIIRTFASPEPIPDPNLPKKRSKYFIALKKNDGKALESLHSFTPFVAPLGKFYADPMLFKHDGLNYLFYEDYDYKKGTIAYVTVSEDMKISEPTPVLELSCHLSFPHVFESEGSIYMTPETIDYREVGLYTATNFPGGWKKERVLVSGDDFTDAIVFKYDNYYWLFTAIQTTELRIFFAKSLSEEFMPHPINSKKIDGRNAGTVFYHNEKLIRPVMDCKKIHGYSMILKEIVTLTPTEFVEKEIATILPTWAPGLDGTHTYNQNEDLVTYDGRRSIFPEEDAEYSS